MLSLQWLLSDCLKSGTYSAVQTLKASVQLKAVLQVQVLANRLPS